MIYRKLKISRKKIPQKTARIVTGVTFQAGIYSLYIEAGFFFFFFLQTVYSVSTINPFDTH